MNKFYSFILVFMVSLPLIAQNSNPIFIGNFSPEVKESILSNHNSDLYGTLLNCLRQFPSQSLCDDTLWNNNDSISGCEWSNIPWNDSIAYVSLSDFSDCYLMVFYRVKICPNNPLIRQIEVQCFIPLYYNSQCDSLQNYLNFGDEYQQAIRIQAIMNELNLLVSQYEADQMSSIPPCSSLSNNFLHYVFYKEVACQSKIKIIHKPDSMPRPLTIYPRVSCSRDVVCCKTSVTYCQDSVGNIHQQITKELVGSYCDGYAVELDFEHILDSLNQHGTVLNFVIYPCMNVCE